MGYWLSEYRKYRLLRGCSGGIHGSASALSAATATGSPVRMGTAAEQAQRGRAIQRLREDNVKENTKDAHQYKIFEWFEYADYARGSMEEAQRYHISFVNIYDFVFYTSFREKKKLKEANKRKRDAGDYLIFDPVDYENVMATKGEEHR